MYDKKYSFVLSKVLLPDLSSEAFAINRAGAKGAKGAVTNIDVRNRNLSLGNLPIRL